MSLVKLAHLVAGAVRPSKLAVLLQLPLLLIALQHTASAQTQPPSAPSVTATAGKAKVVLNWGSVNASQYFIYKSSSASGPFGGYVGMTSAPSTTYTDTTVTNGSTYFYYVQARNSAGYSPNSNTASAQVTLDPPSPGSAAGVARITLSWNAVPYADSYRVHKQQPNGTFAYIWGSSSGSNAQTTYTDYHVPNGHTYSYQVYSYNSAGISNGFGQVSAHISLDPPSGVSISYTNPLFLVTWNAVADASYYRVYRSTTGADGSFSYIWSTQSSTLPTQYSPAPPPAGTVFYYTVRSYNAGGESSDSAVVSTADVGGGPNGPHTCTSPLDSAGLGGGSGASAGDPVNLANGKEVYEPEPDLTVYNPSGPGVVWRRNYRGEQALRGYASPGLSAGWVHTFDNYLSVPTTSGAWGAVKLVYHNGATETLTPVLDAGGQPTGVLTTPAGVPYMARGVPGGAVNQWQSVTLTWKDQSQWRFTQLSGATYALSRVGNRTGQSIDLAWLGDRSLSQISDTTSGSTLLSFAYGGNGRLSSVTDAYGRQVSYTYGTPYGTTPGKLQAVSRVAAAGAPSAPPRWSYTYSLNAGQQLKTITVPSPTGSGDSTATLNYANTGKVTSLVDANGNQRVYTYNASNTQVQVKDAAGSVVAAWTQNFNAGRQDTGVVDANNKSTSVEYNDASNPLKPTRFVDKNGKATTYTYDQKGNVLTVTSPRNVTTVYTWNYTAFELGRLTSVKEGAKPATTFTYYEPSGLLQSVTSPSPTGSGTVTASYTYDALGNVLSFTGPGNNAASQITTAFNYTTDGAYTQAAKSGQPLTLTNNLGHVSRRRYDAQGRVTSAADALGNETGFAYNVAGQLETTTFPATGQTGTGRGRSVNTFLYPGGPLTAVTLFDESGAQTRQVSYAYGKEGEPLSVAGSTDPFTQTFDALYRPKTLKDGNNNQTTYTYDAVGNVSGVQLPGGETIQFTSHDPSGRALRRVDGNGAVTNYVYDDPENLLTDIQYPATPSLDVHFGYDSYGRRVSVTDGSGAHAYAYGDRDELRSATTTYTGLPSQTITYAYNPDGSRQSMTTPAGAFAYSYDGAGRLSGLNNPFGEATSWERFANGWVSAQALANGVRTTYAYNAGGQLTGLTNSDWAGAAISQFGLIKYDGAGNRTELTASIPGLPSLGGTTQYQYDAKDQLKREQTTRGGGFTDDFDYDAAGNPVAFLGAAKTYNANNQQVGPDFSFDSNGNPTTYGGVGLSFDPENRLTAYGTALSAGYRGDGLRAWKQGAQGRTYFLYDGELPVVELDSAGAVKAANTFGGAALVSRRSGAQSTFYTFDPQGSVSERLNAAGAVVSRHQFKAHGAEVTAAAGDDPFGYGAQWGYYTDRETGLQLLTLRYYDPQNGRFVTRDPIGYAGGLNLYAHVRNNPLMFSDPAGLDGWGNDLATWLDDKVGLAEEYYRHDDHEWVANGVNASVAQVVRGVVDLLRVGSGTGHALYDCDDNIYGRAAHVAMDVVRAAGIFQMVAGPFAGRAAQCFVAGTLVQTAEGTKKIEEIEAGDVVLSADPAQPATAGREPLRQGEVVRTFARAVDEVVDIRVGRETITATTEHPFWVVGAGWTAAGELRRGSALLTSGGVVVHVDSVERRRGGFTVYNFEVADSHTYFVSPLGLLVHNQCQIQPGWGRNRTVKELHDQGFVYDGPTNSGGGQMYKNPVSGEEVRIMPRPNVRYRNDPPAKHANDYYYRYRSGPDQPWGPHTTIPNK